MHFLRIGAIGLLVAGLLASSQALAARRTVVDIKQTVLSDGVIRYSVPISFGGLPAIDVMLDTGSTGIRILPRAAAASALPAGEPAGAYGYSSGVRLNGNLAMVPIAIGTLTAATPIRVEAITTVDCFPNRPNCPASRIPPADYGLGGDGLPKEGFEAIMGINSNPADIDNPLIRMGVHAWIIELPRPGDRTPGELILNPDARDRAGFDLFDTNWTLHPNFPSHDPIPGCLVIAAAKRICGPTLLDTGNQGILITAGTAADASGWTKGEQVALVFTDRQNRPVSDSLVAGRIISSQIRAEQQDTVTHISAGVLPYFSFSVLYDNDDHMIGLKRR